jgi:hypothetical protein
MMCEREERRETRDERYRGTIEEKRIGRRGKREERRENSGMIRAKRRIGKKRE